MSPFKRKVNDDGVLLTLKDKQAYQKPSEKRKMAKAAGRARHLKKIAKRKEEYGKKRRCYRRHCNPFHGRK
jgi:ribosomal protein S21